MPDDVNLQNMNDVEIAALATRCLDALDLADRVQAALRAFHDNDARNELATWVQEAIDAANTEDDEE